MKEENIINVLIGIQARSTSDRLPRKSFAMIGHKRMLDHVIDSVERAANYANRFSSEKNYSVMTALLIPRNDPIKNAFRSKIQIFEGDENDVLDRYMKAAEYYQADFICRITGDCPLIPPYIISKHISIALVNKYDYISNVDEACRLSLDGIDCEVMSFKMLDWLDQNEKTPEGREHVTLLARSNPPDWSKRGFTASYFSQANIKLSVDTDEDLKRVIKEYENVGNALREAKRKYDIECIHRF